MTNPVAIHPKNPPASASLPVEGKRALPLDKSSSTLTSLAPALESSCWECICSTVCNWVSIITNWISSWFSPSEEDLSLKRRQHRKEIWEETASIAKQHCLPNIQYSVSSSYKYTLDIVKPIKLRMGKHETEVVISHEDQLDMAFHAQKTGSFSVMALNIGDPSVPGGGYKEGLPGREEEIMRRTTLAFVLDESLGYSQNMYPLRENEGIYAKNVTILRAKKKYQYAFLDSASIGFLTIASANNSESIRNKIRLQFRIAKKEKHDLLVLGTFGKECASVYKEVLEKEFKGCFKMVIFCIREESERLQYQQVFRPKHTTLKEALSG